MSRWKNFVGNIGLFFVAVLVCAVLVEVGLAMLQINQKSHVRLVPGKGITHMPGAYYRHTKEGFSEGYFNSHGFRDFERTVEKPPGTFRILVFGDSYVEALQVALEESFPALLEQKLNVASSSKMFEVIALGQSGFGTADAFMRYMNFGKEFSPDLVILAFLTGNDFRNNSKVLIQEALAFYFVLDKDGNLVLDNSNFEEYERNLTLPKRLFQTLKRHSYLASLVSERLYLLKRQLREGRSRNRLLGEHVEEEKLDELSDWNVYRLDMGKMWRDAFEITKEVILKFKNTVEENGAKFVLVSLSNAEQVHLRNQEKLQEKYSVTFDFDQPDRVLEKFAMRKKINYLKLMPVFRQYHLQTGVDLHGFGSNGVGHWNEQGHWLAAETIFHFLKQENLVPL